MSFEIVLHLVLFINVVLIVWFKTDAFLEYSRLFGLTKIFKIDKYDEEYNNDFTLDYHTFLLKEYKESFFVKLITCPICLIIWGAIISSLFFGHLHFSPITICSIVLYFGVSKLMA